jgi:RNA-directed DNA polymerase
MRNTAKTLMDISEDIWLKSRGWINYYGKFRKSELRKVFNPINRQIARWYAKKHKCGYIEASQKIQQIAKAYKHLFMHWLEGYTSF